MAGGGGGGGGGGPGGGSTVIIIGDPVQGGDPHTILFIDGSGNLSDDVDFNYDPAVVCAANPLVGFQGGLSPVLNMGFDHDTVAARLLSDGRFYGGVNLRTLINNTCLMIGEYRGDFTGGWSYRSRRSRTGPLTTLDGDILGTYYAEGFDSGTPEQVHAAAGIDIIQQGDAGNGYVPGKMVFQTSGLTSTGPQNRLVIDRDGVVTILTAPLAFGSSINGIINSVNGTYANVNTTGLNNGSEFAIRSGTATDTGGDTLFRAEDKFISGGPRVLIGPGTPLVVSSFIGFDVSVNGIFNSPNGVYLNVDSTNLNNGSEFVVRSGTATDTGGTTLFRVEDQFISGGPVVVVPSGVTLSVNGGAGLGSGAGIVTVGNATTVPTTNPTGGGLLYADNGAGKWRGSSGTVSTFGPAEPHCAVCGSDYGHEWSNPRWGRLQFCALCLAEHIAKDFGGELPPWIRREGPAEPAVVLGLG